MEDLILKYADFGGMTLVTLYLLTKGMTSLSKLTEQIISLEQSINRLSRLVEKVQDIDSRLTLVEREIFSKRKD